MKVAIIYKWREYRQEKEAIMKKATKLAGFTLAIGVSFCIFLAPFIKGYARHIPVKNDLESKKPDVKDEITITPDQLKIGFDLLAEIAEDEASEEVIKEATEKFSKEVEKIGAKDRGKISYALKWFFEKCIKNPFYTIFEELIEIPHEVLRIVLRRGVTPTIEVAFDDGIDPILGIVADSRLCYIVDRIPNDKIISILLNHGNPYAALGALAGNAICRDEELDARVVQELAEKQKASA